MILCANKPSSVLQNFALTYIGSEEDDDECSGANHGGVVAHKDLVVLLVGVRLLHHALPDHLGKVDGKTVRYHQYAQVCKIPALHTIRPHSQQKDASKLLNLLEILLIRHLLADTEY